MPDLLNSTKGELVVKIGRQAEAIIYCWPKRLHAVLRTLRPLACLANRDTSRFSISRIEIFQCFIRGRAVRFAN